MHNPMCDGNHCRHETGPVKFYPTGGGGGMIYCVACWFHENDYRRRRGIETKNPEGWPQLSWDTAEEYANEQGQCVGPFG